MARTRFHNGVTPCPVCQEPVNLSTQSVIRLPDLLGAPRPEWAGLEGVYHRVCLTLHSRFPELATTWEDWQRECFRQRNHSQSLFNNVIAFDTDRFLCYRYLHSFEHQLFEFPRLLDWHLSAEQLQTLMRIFIGLNEDAFATEQQVFHDGFAARIDPVQELVEVVRFWSLILPVTVTDQEFIKLGDHLNLAADLATKPQLVDFARLHEQTGIRDRSDDPEFIPDNLQGELIGFAPSQLHQGMMNLNVRIHPRDEIALTLWEALELRASLMDYTAQLDVTWELEPLLGTGETVSDDDLPLWE